MRAAKIQSRYLFTTLLPLFVLVFSTTAWAQVEVEPVAPQDSWTVV